MLFRSNKPYNQTISFKITDTGLPLYEIPALQEAWTELQPPTTAKKTTCIVTGKQSDTAKIHNPLIKCPMKQAQGSGCRLVSFNEASVESYGMKQSSTIPICKNLVFNYANGLNVLIQDERHRIRFHNQMFVFWTREPDPVAEELTSLLGFAFAKEDKPLQSDALLHQIKDYLTVLNAQAPPPEAHIPFFFLGLKPMVSRLAVTMWETSTLGRIATNMLRFFEETSLADVPSKVTLLKILLTTYKTLDRLTAPMEQSVLRSALFAAPYPLSLIQQIQLRINADIGSSDEKLRHYALNSIRIGMLKAYLLRNTNYISSNNLMSLDTSNNDVGYLLGRLFFIVTHIQELVLPHINTTLKDTHYALASSKPKQAFLQIHDKTNYHLKKLKARQPKKATMLESVIEGIYAKIQEALPEKLDLTQKSLFHIAFHHQKSSLTSNTSA